MLTTANDYKSRNLNWLIFNLIISPLTEQDTFFIVHNAAQSHFLEQASHRVAHWLHLPQQGGKYELVDKNVIFATQRI